MLHERVAGRTEDTMQRRRHRTFTAVAILYSIVAAGTQTTMAEVRVDDLPKPIPQIMEKVKEVGNEAGKGLSKAASTAADAVNKAVKGQTSGNHTSPASQKSAK